MNSEDLNELMQGTCVHSIPPGSSDPSSDVAMVAMQMLKAKDKEVSKLHDTVMMLHEETKMLHEETKMLYKEKVELQEMRHTLENESITLLKLQGCVHIRGALELAVDRARDKLTMRNDGVQGVINKRLDDPELIKSIRYPSSGTSVQHHVFGC